MKYSKFEIQGYRAIDDTSIAIGKNTLIPIIGINEAGKTSLLQAILSFDKSKDKTNKGNHLNYENKYQTKAAPCVIKAHINFESQGELEDFIAALKIRIGDVPSIRTALTTFFDNNESFIIIRDLETKRYSIDNSVLPASYEKKTVSYFLDKLPLILYFDDFSDRVPEIIEFPLDYDGNTLVLRNSVKAEWQALLEEVFKRTTGGEYTLKEFFEIEDSDKREGVLSDVRDVLNDEIIEDWKALKKRGSAFADDELDLELKLDYTIEEDSRCFRFKVIDKSKDGKTRQFNITDRSKGFQWFFNFTLKLKFNSKYISQPTDAIFLLDEPGSYLHASAQEELLKELSKISKTNNIFYCTHSQHLLNPEIINVSSIKIASKENGSVKLNTFSSTNKNKNLGALTPLYDALRMKSAFSGFNNDESFILTEGITDYYLISMLSKYSSLINLDKKRLIPGAGAGQLKDLISLAIANGAPYMIIFDNDGAGRTAIERYEGFFGTDVSSNFFKYGDGVSADFVLENYFNEDDETALLAATNSTNSKAAIIKLFYLSEDEQMRFITSLSTEFTRKFGRIASTINNL